jgi:hypothetical protein
MLESRSVPRGLCFAVLILSAGCASRPGDKPQTITDTTTNKPVAGHPVLSMPITITGQRTRLVPLAMQSAKGVFDSSDPFDRGGVSFSRSSRWDHALARVAADANADVVQDPGLPWMPDAQVRWHNVIAHGAHGREWLILPTRGVIGRWSMFGSMSRDSSRTVECKGLLFIAVVADTNSDQSLNSLDARVAIVTDADASNPRHISPADAQVWSTSYDLASDCLFLEVVKDTTGDGVFDYNDTPVPYVWKRGSDDLAVPLLSAEIVNKALELLK